MRQIHTIFVHCSATRPDWMDGQGAQRKRDEIDRWHKQNGWSGIGYHFVIDRDGEIAAGRPVDQVGAHVKGHNTNSIGVCLIGGFGSNENDRFTDHYTSDQAVALRNLIDRLKREYPSIKHVRGHNEVAAKACPGFNVARWMEAKPPRTVAQSTTMQASAVQVGTAASGAVAAVGALDGVAQVVAIAGALIVCAAALWIMRERLRQWARGHR